ncbi:winged helix-turn-helix domain-containing protein [Candidatus Leptofilum sp.]|uniref:winged helix-turn-helix domain-containing protein n=1 Tax=Candidatus Leptofilum sp. TaxID=3241576 RepID=UPI003B59F39A
MKPRLNLWLEVEGDVVFSIWRMQLLQAVAETGSISGAAAAMETHYRTAWEKINEMETRLGKKLVDTQVGGQQGGGAQLTPLAQQLITAFAQFSQEVEKEMQEWFTAVLAPVLANPPNNSN